MTWRLAAQQPWLVNWNHLKHHSEGPFLSTDDPRFLWLKYQILMYFEDCLKTIEVKSAVYESSEKQKIFIFNHKSIKSIKINVHTVMEQAYKVFDYA